MSNGLQERQSTPLTLHSSVEPLNTTNLSNQEEILPESSKPVIHVLSGYNSGNRGGMSAKHNVFVIGVDGKPLTPTTNTKARKLMEGNQARPVWNKFNRFGLQMLGSTTDEIENVYVATDSHIYLGDGQEASIHYNGSHLRMQVT